MCTMYLYIRTKLVSFHKLFNMKLMSKNRCISLCRVPDGARPCSARSMRAK